MKNNTALFLIMMSLLVMSCSQNTKNTSAKLKLNLSGITNINSNIGRGGVLLFGKSSTGEQFGKLVNGPEVDLNLANGEWSFYAVMWENNFAKNFNDTVYCGKSMQVLNGAAVSVGLSLTNAQCAGVDFSSGNHYVSANSKIRFPDLYIEECDDLTQSDSFACKRDNQGSALSYRMVFKSYTKAPNGPPILSNEVLYSKCMASQGASSVMQTGMDVNFPTAFQAMPFIISTEMFLGSDDCNSSGTLSKGMYTHTFTNGIAAQSSLINKVVPSDNQTCSGNPTNKNDCEKFLGIWSAVSSACSVPTMIKAFLPAAQCPGTMTELPTRYLKQMVTIPKDFLCSDVNKGLSGAEVFSGGDGSFLRPFKICDEWQLNQIGEKHTTSNDLKTKSFKLMNDLDMNRADFNPLLRPTCIGASGSLYKRHHNLNPLDQKTGNDCGAELSSNSYTGTFNGNNKTISHARIYVNTDNVGFVGRLGEGGVIKNLNFENLEVEAMSYVGGVAGIVEGSTGLISNVNIQGGSIDCETGIAGGIAGEVVAGPTISSVRVENFDIYSSTKIGGLVAKNAGIIEKSMFRGKIHQHSSVDDNVGGLVGEADENSIIKNSFSEGQIESYAKWTGGIAGINAGEIYDSYSTMYVLSKFASLYAHVGGIAAGNHSGDIKAVYFNGGLSYEGGQSSDFVIDPIAAAGGVVNECVIQTSDTSSASCGMTNLHSGNTTFKTIASAGEWTANVVGSLPRLKWESESNSRPCLLPQNLLALTSQTRSGTVTNPFIICTADQLKSLTSTMSGVHAVLGEDIKISHWLRADLISNFGGDLNGLGYSIYGLNLSQTNYTGNMGIFVNNSGKIHNLNIVGNRIINSNGVNNTGILTGINSGSIQKISMFNNTAEGAHYVGMITGSNTGVIDDVYINEGSLSGVSIVGGVAGHNTGGVTRTSVNSKIMNVSGNNSYHKFGGIVGFNAISGNVDQVVYAGQMNLGPSSTHVEPYLGGIIGYNDGALSNAMTKKYSALNVMNFNTVGGLIGFNSGNGSLKKSLSFGKVLYSKGTIPASSTFSQTVGSNNGGSVEENSTFLLENNSAGFLGSASVAYCTGNSSFMGNSPSFLTASAVTAGTDANLIFKDNGSGNYDDNQVLLPIFFNTDYTIPIANCISGREYFFYRSYEPSQNAKKTAEELKSIEVYADFNIAYESEGTTAIKQTELIEFYKARMYKKPMPASMVAPVWVFEDNQWPRLLQVND